MKSSKRLWLSFDEWNVWYRARGGNGNRAVAPHLLEEVYNLEDALLVGGLINTLLRRADRVKVACLAQLVNVIAPLMTDSKQVIRQTIYYPYAWALAHCRGQVLDIGVQSAVVDGVPNVDVAATFDAAKKEYAVLLLNRDLAKEQEVALVFRDDAPSRALGFDTFTGPDLKAANTLANPKAVMPAALENPKAGARMTVRVPRQSYSILRLGV